MINWEKWTKRKMISLKVVDGNVKFIKVPYKLAEGYRLEYEDIMTTSRIHKRDGVYSTGELSEYIKKKLNLESEYWANLSTGKYGEYVTIFIERNR